MYLNRSFIAQHKVNVAIIIFIILLLLFHYFKPGFAYNNEGGFRPFGVGFRNKTVIPVWVVAIILGVFSYLLALFMIQ
jgi:hypothetical protein